jgi:hypothetical protein
LLPVVAPRLVACDNQRQQLAHELLEPRPVVRFDLADFATVFLSEAGPHVAVVVGVDRGALDVLHGFGLHGLLTCVATSF